MQNRLKDLYAPADQVRSQSQMAARMNQAGINVQGPTQEAYQRNATRTRREIDTALKEEYQNQEKLTKLITKREEKLKNLQDQQKQLVRGSKEELEVVEKIGRVKENISKQNEFYRQRESVLNQALSARKSLDPYNLQAMMQAYKTGGVKGLGSSLGGMMGGLAPAGIVGALGTGISGIGAAVGAGSEMYRAYGRAPVETAAAIMTEVMRHQFRCTMLTPQAHLPPRFQYQAAFLPAAYTHLFRTLRLLQLSLDRASAFTVRPESEQPEQLALKDRRG